MLPKAYTDSLAFVKDPLYSVEAPNPPDPCEGGRGFWIYGQYEFEAFILEKMCREKNEAKLKVGYTKFRRVPQKTLSFSAAFDAEEKILLRFCGTEELLWQGAGTLQRREIPEGCLVTLPGAGRLTVTVRVSDIEKEIPALYVEKDPEKWCSTASGEQRFTARPARADGVIPHRAVMAQAELVPEKCGEKLWDAGREVICYVDIKSAPGEKAELFVGESLPEAENNDPAHEEQTGELISLAPGHFTSKVPLALRYIRVENARSPEVKLRCLFHPAAYRGAFAAPEEPLLTQIWLQSAYTLRLCMMNFLNDGIKRDRLPWAGDLAVSLMGNASVFLDNTITRDTLSVLGAVSVETAHINTIVDYTLWHLISHNVYQQFSGDREFLKQEFPRLKETLTFLLNCRCDAKGLLIVAPKDWLFIDWVPGEKYTALQMLFVMALRAGAALAERLEEKSFEKELLAAAEKAEQSIRECAFDRERRLFAAAPGSGEFSRHANMLAVIADVADDAAKESIASALADDELPPVGTPYMSFFESLALARCGKADEALKKIRTIWGGMLALGATTFWEGFDPAHKENEHLVFYGRPFGKSLCHAWSAGPLWLFFEILLGIRPEKDGWETFSISPLPDATVSAVIPVPQGRIEIECIKGKIVKLLTPPGCTRV